MPQDACYRTEAETYCRTRRKSTGSAPRITLFESATIDGHRGVRRGSVIEAWGDASDGAVKDASVNSERWGFLVYDVASLEEDGANGEEGSPGREQHTDVVFGAWLSDLASPVSLPSPGHGIIFRLMVLRSRDLERLSHRRPPPPARPPQRHTDTIGGRNFATRKKKGFNFPVPVPQRFARHCVLDMTLVCIDLDSFAGMAAVQVSAAVRHHTRRQLQLLAPLLYSASGDPSVIVRRELRRSSTSAVAHLTPPFHTPTFASLPWAGVTGIAASSLQPAPACAPTSVPSPPARPRPAIVLTANRHLAAKLEIEPAGTAPPPPLRRPSLRGRSTSTLPSRC